MFTNYIPKKIKAVKVSRNKKSPSKKYQAALTKRYYDSSVKQTSMFHESDLAILLTSKVALNNVNDSPAVDDKVKSGVVDFNSFFQLNKLRIDLFDFSDEDIKLSDPISAHCDWVFQNIYSPFKTPIQLYSNHDMQHIVRTTMYVTILTNLYRKNSDSASLALTDNQLKLMQLAMLFYNASLRSTENNSPYAVVESAALLYGYLVKKLKVDQETASQITEALANKYWTKGNAYYTFEQQHDAIIWKSSIVANKNKTIYQKIIHDAHYLDNIRFIKFDGSRLNIYSMVKNSQNNAALNEIAQLIMQVRSLIEIQGDNVNYKIFDIKKNYNAVGAYHLMIADIHLENYSFLSKLFSNDSLLSSNELSSIKLIEENVLNEKIILARGIILPSIDRTMFGVESATQCEVRKAKKTFPFSGNANRSVSVLGNGGGVFSDAGFLIFNYNKKDISHIYGQDADTGHGKKSLYGNNFYRYRSLEELERKMKLGGETRYFRGKFDLDYLRGFNTTHTELLFNIEQFDAVYFTNDMTLETYFYHFDELRSLRNASFAPLLKAIYIQQCYQDASNKMLPIYEYSGVHNFLTISKPYEDTQLLEIWEKTCSQYIENEIAAGRFFELRSCDIRDVIKQSTYPYRHLGKMYSYSLDGLDYYYPENLKMTIHDSVEAIRAHYIAEESKKQSYREVTLYSLFSQLMNGGMQEDKQAQSTPPTVKKS